MLKTLTLENGLKVASYSLPGKHSLYLSLSVHCGSLYESPEESGLAHFLEHILAEGIPSLPSATQISSFIEDRAGNYNLTTSRGRINFWVSLPKDHLNDALKIAKELFFEPLFDERAIEKEKQSVYHEIRSKMDQEFYKFWIFWKQNRYTAENPLRRMTVGSLETVGNLTRDQVVNFWKKHFLVNNCSLAVVGGFDHGELEKMVETIFGGLKKGPKIPRVKLSEKLLSQRRTVFEKRSDLANNKLSFSWGSISFDEKWRDEFTFEDIADRTLASMASSRLHRKLRAETGLVYGVWFSRERYRGLGFSEIESRVSSENLEKVSQIIYSEILDIYENGVTKEEFNRVIKYKINRSLMSQDHPGAMAQWIEDDLFSYDTIEMPKDYVSRIGKFHYHQVADHVKKYWDLNKLNLMVQGPADESVSTRLAGLKIGS